MPDTTSVLELPFPESADAPDVAGDVEALAQKVEDLLTPTGLASGHGLLWDGTGWIAADIVTAAELAAHEADTTNVHGITDTSALALDADIATAVSAHEADTTAVHGIADTAVLLEQATAATALPGSPQTGDLIALQTAAMAAMSPPVKWVLYYDGTKWLPLGCPPLEAEVETSEALASSGSWTTLATSGPSVALPAAGDYDIEWGCVAYWDGTAGSNGIAGMGIARGASNPANSDTGAWIVSNRSSAAGEWAGISRRQRLSGAAAAAAITAKYRGNVNYGTFFSRWLSVTPVRLG